MNLKDVSAIRDKFSTLSKRANESLGSFDQGSIGIGRYVPGASPWERHNNGDELLYITDGDVQIELLIWRKSLNVLLEDLSVLPHFCGFT